MKTFFISSDGRMKRCSYVNDVHLAVTHAQTVLPACRRTIGSFALACSSFPFSAFWSSWCSPTAFTNIERSKSSKWPARSFFR